jgi:hypothetical protein
MKRTLLALLVLGVVFVASVRAQEGEEAAAEAPAPKPKPKPKPQPKPQPKRKAAAAIPLEGLPKLPISPLSMDAAALKDDVRLFDQLPKALSGNENVAALTESLKKASSLLAKMKRDVESEKVWTKNVYDIIQNYQYKYLKTVKDVKMREKKVAKLERLVTLLKQSTLHTAVERELTKASKALRELVSRSGKDGAKYGKITARMKKLRGELTGLQRPRQLYSETAEKMQKVLRSDIPPHTGDALSNLVNGAAPAKAKAPKATAAGKGKAKPKAAKKAAKGKGKGKAKPKAKAAKPKAKKF